MQQVRVWEHPHMIGPLVIEDERGQLWLVFTYRAHAWATRVPWLNGISSLLPHPTSDAALRTVDFVAQDRRTPVVESRL